MKPEPLKNKGVIGQYSDYENFGDSIEFKERMFFKSEIKSAVEWLKKKIDEYCIGRPPIAVKNDNTIYTVVDLIDEAFEDVMKSKEGE